MDFRKTYYILPNLFTLSSVVCGFISISLSASGQGGSDLYQAALAICFGFFFDTADGRVARLTKTQTDLGRDLDSLADVITFGAAPALLVYKWGLTSFGRLGIFIAGLFVCAGAMRLARFNVLSRREEAAGQKDPGKYTLGLTDPGRRQRAGVHGRWWPITRGPTSSSAKAWSRAWCWRFRTSWCRASGSGRSRTCG